MELIAAVLFAGPLGYLFRSRRLGLGLYLLLWALILPFQTASVHADHPDDIGIGYAVVNAAILGVGIGLNALGARRRTATATSSATQA